jgi:hypothetical protein
VGLWVWDIEISPAALHNAKKPMRLVRLLHNLSIIEFMFFSDNFIQRWSEYGNTCPMLRSSDNYNPQDCIQ